MNTDLKAIEEVVKLYIESYLKADPAGIANAFHADTRLLSIDQGQMEQTRLSSWLEGLQRRRDSGDVREADSTIESVDATGDAAIVKARLRFKQFSFVDYLSLLKIEEGWKIVGKIYTVQSVNP